MRPPVVRVGKGPPATPNELEVLLNQYQGSWATAAGLLVGGLRLSMVPTWKSYRVALKAVLEGAGWCTAVSFVDSLRGGQLSTHALFKALLHLSTTCTSNDHAASMRVLEASLQRGVSVGYGGFAATCKRLVEEGADAEVLRFPLVMARHKIPVGADVTEMVMRVCATQRGGAWVHAASLFAYAGPGQGSERTVMLLRSLQGGQWASGVGAFVASNHIARRQPETLAAAAHLLQRGGKWQIAFSIASQLALVDAITPEVNTMLDEQCALLPWEQALCVAFARKSRTPDSLAISVGRVPPEAWEVALRVAAAVGTVQDKEPLLNLIPHLPTTMLGAVMRSPSRGEWISAMHVLARATDRSAAVMAVSQLRNSPPCSSPLLAAAAVRHGVVAEFIAATSLESAVLGLAGSGRWEEAMQHARWHLRGPCAPLEGILADRGLWAEAVQYSILVGGSTGRTVAAPLCIVHRQWQVLHQLLASVPSLTDVERSMMRHATQSLLSDQLTHYLDTGKVLEAVTLAKRSKDAPTPLVLDRLCKAGLRLGLVDNLISIVGRATTRFDGSGVHAVRLLVRWSTSKPTDPLNSDDVLARCILNIGSNSPMPSPIEITSILGSCPLVFSSLAEVVPKPQPLVSSLVQWADKNPGAVSHEWWSACAQMLQRSGLLNSMPWTTGALLLKYAADQLPPSSVSHLMLAIPPSHWLTSLRLLQSQRHEPVRRGLRDHLCRGGHWLPAMHLAEGFAGGSLHDRQLYIYALQESRSELLTKQSGSWVQAARLLRTVTNGPQQRILRREVLSTAPSAAWMAACRVLQDAVTDKDPTVTYGDVERVLRFCAQRGCTVAATQIIDWYMRVAGGRVSDKQFTLLIEATLAAPHSLTAAQNAFVISTMRRVARASSQHRLVDSLVSLLQDESPASVVDEPSEDSNKQEDYSPMWTEERKKVVAAFYPLLMQKYPSWSDPTADPSSSELFTHIASEGLGGQVTAADVHALWFGKTQDNQRELGRMHTTNTGCRRDVPPSVVSEVLHKVKYGTPSQIKAVRDNYFPTMTLPDMRASLYSRWKEAREYRSRAPSAADSAIPITDELLVRLTDYASCDLESPDVWRHLVVVLFNGCAHYESIGKMLSECSGQVIALAAERWPRDAELELLDIVDKTGSPPKALYSLPGVGSKEIVQYHQKFKSVLESGSSFSPNDLVAIALSPAPVLITSHSSRAVSRLKATQGIRLEDARHSSGLYEVEGEDTCSIEVDTGVRPRQIKDDRSLEFTGRSLRRQKKILGYVPSESVARFMMVHGNEDYHKAILYLKELGCDMLVQPVKQSQHATQFAYMQHQPLLRSLFCTAQSTGTSFSDAIRRELARLVECPQTVEEGRSLWREIVSRGDDTHMTESDRSAVRTAIARS